MSEPVDGQFVPKIVVLDFETEGLNQRSDFPLEIHALHVQEHNLEILSEFNVVGTERFNGTPHNVVQDMHALSGLFDEMEKQRRAGQRITPSDMDLALLKFLQGVSPEPKQIMLCGNSIGQFDVKFMDRYTPRALRHCHHRVIDVSGFLEMYKLWHTELPPPAKVHRARADCLMSLELLKMARRTMQHARAYENLEKAALRSAGDRPGPELA